MRPAPSLKTKFFVYLAAVHVPFLGLGLWLLPRHRELVLLVEAGLLASLVIGVSLVRSLFGALDLVRSGAAFLSERDFGSRLLPTGQRELDELVDVYNRMLDSLREERIRLEEQQWFLEKVLRASPSGILTFDFEGRVAFANPRAEAMLESETGGLPGRRLGELASPFAHRLEGALNLRPGEARVVPHAGSRRVKVQRSEFLDRGFPRPFLVLEELTEELRQSEKAAYEKVIRMMSHEVNNSLAAAGSLLESCRTYGSQLAPEDQPDFEGAIGIVLARTARLSDFMREFAEVVKLPPPRRHPASLAELADGVAVLMREDARGRGVDLRRATEGLDLEVLADKRQIEQVLVNVVKNALEAIETRPSPGGVVTLRTGTRNGRPLLEVEDDGPGLSDAVREQLFQPFFTTKEYGQGIGLTVIREVLAAHGCAYSLEGPAGGPTRFTILF